MSRPTAQPRDHYRWFTPITTRWMDNDVYGHINNVTYYSFFDSAVNRYLIDSDVLNVHEGKTIGLVVETHCNYFAPLAFPDAIEAGVRVAQVGTSSVRYEVGIFAAGAASAAACGHFVHVYVDRVSRRPVPLDDAFRRAVQALTAPSQP